MKENRKYGDQKYPQTIMSLTWQPSFPPCQHFRIETTTTTSQPHFGACFLGCVYSATPESSSFNLSPIILGALLTLLILCCVVVSKMYSKKRSHSDETLNGSKQSNALLCKQDMAKVSKQLFTIHVIHLMYVYSRWQVNKVGGLMGIFIV